MKLAADLVRCPVCHKGFLSIRGETTARCGTCHAEFQVKDGVIDLLPQTQHNSGFAQRLMEKPWLVRIYESRMWRRNPLAEAAIGCSFEEEQAHVIRALSLRPDARVLDLACGPGNYTRPLARALPHGTAIGLDISQPMISFAASRANDEGISNIVWLRASALDLPFEDASLDGVNCCGALHLFPDIPRVLAGIFRTLKPGGRFVSGMGRRFDGQLAGLQTFITDRIGLTIFSSTELAALLKDAGFSDVKVNHAKRIWQIVSAVRER